MSATEPQENRVRNLNGKFLTFLLDHEEYGVEVLRVKEIVGMMEITPIPMSPEFVKGIINLRGKIIPVIDLRLKFELKAAEYDDKTCIIVTELNTADTEFVMGLIVDTVCEVINVTPDIVEPSPRFGGNFDPRFILGVAKLKGTIKTLLDINGILSAEELISLEEL